MDQHPLQVDREVDNLIEALSGFMVDGVALTCRPVFKDATRDDLENATLEAASAHIFHFAGHGAVFENPEPHGSGLAPTGYLVVLRDRAERTSRLLDAQDLARLLRRAGVRLAVLGACDTARQSMSHPWHSVAGALVAHDVPAVIAMQTEVLDPHATAFSLAFYTALAAGLSLDEAVSVGRLGMLAKSASDAGGLANVEWGIPVLYSRLRDGRLFPERMVRKGQAAEALRIAVHQTVERIEAHGEVMGIRMARTNRSFAVEQQAEVVLGVLTGAAVNRNGEDMVIRVDQKVSAVGPGAKVTGLDLDELK